MWCIQRGQKENSPRTVQYKSIAEQTMVNITHPMLFQGYKEGP